MLLPPIVLIALSLLVRWSGWVPDKVAAEQWAIGLLYAAIALAGAQYLWRREAYWLWLTLFAGTVLFREYHFHNTSVGAFAILIGLLLYAWRHYARFGAYFAGRTTITLLAAMLLSYLLAAGCDKGLFDWLSGNLGLQNRVEEYLENLGHIFLLLLTLVSRRADNPLVRAPG